MGVNINKKVNTILSSLRKPNKKVDLGIVNEIESEYDRLENAYGDITYLAYEFGDEIMDAYNDFRLEYNLDDFIVNGYARDYEEVSNIVSNQLAIIERNAEELGVAPEEIYGYYGEAKSFVENKDEILRDALEKYRETVEFIGAPNFWQ